MGRTQPGTPVDWQNATWSTPAYDVANVVAGCARPDVQRAHWRQLLAHYAAALRAAGGPPLPELEADFATSAGLLFAWMMRYLAAASDREAAERTMLLAHWERVCTGVALR
jgi:aminoglycoside/choline kinase family phosphotransferase